MSERSSLMTVVGWPRPMTERAENVPRNRRDPLPDLTMSDETELERLLWAFKGDSDRGETMRTVREACPLPISRSTTYVPESLADDWTRWLALPVLEPIAGERLYKADGCTVRRYNGGASFHIFRGDSPSQAEAVADAFEREWRSRARRASPRPGHALGPRIA